MKTGTLPGILVLHGGAGVTGHERTRARQLDELGYVTHVPDLFGEVFTSREQGMAMIGGLVADPPRLRARVAAALNALRGDPRVDPARCAAIGFCFGGLAALELARSGADVAAVVSFHGGLQAARPAEPGAIRARVLACTGAADPFCPRDQRAAFEDEMTRAGARWQLHVYGGAQHGFTEPALATGPARPGLGYHADADRQSWRAMRELFDEVL